MRGPFYAFISLPVTEAMREWDLFRQVRNLNDLDVKFIPASGGSFLVLPSEQIRAVLIGRLLRGRRREAILRQFKDFLTATPSSEESTQLTPSHSDSASQLAS